MVVGTILVLYALLECGIGQSFSAHNHHKNHPHDHYNLAKVASRGFFTDIPNYMWVLKEAIHCNESDPALQKGLVMTKIAASYWLHNDLANYFFVTNEPTFTCGLEQKIGSRGDGGKWVCDPHRISHGDCLVYSIGSNNQYDFEDAIYTKLGCEIHTFDPTVKHPSNKSSTFWRVGLRGFANESNVVKDTNGNRRLSHDLKHIGEIVDMLGHSGRRIDIFKIDCEGCEYEVFALEFFSALKERNVTIRQIQVEMHTPLPLSYDGAGQTITKGGIEIIERTFQILQDEGYRIFHKEPNVIADNYGRCAEFAFIQIDSLKDTENCDQVRQISDFHMMHIE